MIEAIAHNAVRRTDWNALQALVFTMVLAGPQAVTGATFDVRDPADLFDAVPGDGICASQNQTCTLRAAVEESNFLPGEDRIDISAGTYVLERPALVLRDNVSLRGGSANRTFLEPRMPITAILEDFLICDSATDNVRRFSFQGQPKGDFIAQGEGGLDLPNAAAFRDRDVFVAGFSSGVHRRDRITGQLDLFIPSGTGQDQVLGPTDLLLVSTDLLVTNFQPGGGVKRFDGTTGAFRGEFIPAGAGGLAFPNSMVLSPFDSRILLVSSTGTNEVLRFNAMTGMPEGTFTSRFSGLRRPRGLAFGPDGNLYVASEGADPVLRFDGRTGAFIDVFITGRAGLPGRPSDLFFFDGVLHVISGRQILRFSRTGAFIGSLLSPSAGVSSPACIIKVPPGPESGPSFEIAEVTMTEGRDSAISVEQRVRLTVTDSVFARNVIEGIGTGAAISNSGQLIVTDSLFESNIAGFRGGAIGNFGQLELTRTTLRSNSAPGPNPSDCGGRSGGGALFNAGLATITASTFSGNASTRGGAIFNLSSEGNISINNSTISGNRAACGGGGLANTQGTAFISFTTITNNLAENAADSGTSRSPERSGGGIFNTGTTTFGNSIIAGNLSSTMPDPGVNCQNMTVAGSTGLLISAGNNVVGVPPGACGAASLEIRAGAHASDRFGDPGVDPMLRNNGGPTETHELLQGSLAIDLVRFNAGDPFFACPSLDQRGFRRPGRMSTLCDAGAFEANAQR